MALGVVKVHAADEVLHHRDEVIAVLGVLLAVSVLRIRLMRVAVAAAALFAVSLEPRSIAGGLALGACAFALLLVVFFGIATALHARQDRLSRMNPQHNLGPTRL